MGWWQEISLAGLAVVGAGMTWVAWRGRRFLALWLVVALITLIAALVGLGYLLAGQVAQFLPLKIAGLAMLYVVPGSLVGLILGHFLRRSLREDRQ
jgi:hypothetical protein